MSKAGLAVVMSLLFEFLVAILPINERLKIPLCIVLAVFLVVAGVAWLTIRAGIGEPEKHLTPKLDLRFSVLGIDYDDAKTELAMHIMFRNSGTVQRTMLSVTFGYRDPDRSFKNSWEFIKPIPGWLGELQPIRINPESEHVETYRVIIPHHFREKVGGVIGLLLNATDPSGAVKSEEVEVIEISKSVPEGSNGIAYTGKRVEGVSFDT
jgi:hypothetical protein